LDFSPEIEVAQLFVVPSLLPHNKVDNTLKLITDDSSGPEPFKKAAEYYQLIAVNIDKK
jgi:hypothetical protein